MKSIPIFILLGNHKKFIPSIIFFHSDFIMSEATVKPIVIDTKELSFKSNQLVEDLSRFLAEALPQLKITLNGSDIEIEMPKKLSKRAIKLRIKRFLYKKGLNGEFRAISLISPEKEGYIVKEKKVLELAYY